MHLCAFAPRRVDVSLAETQRRGGDYGMSDTAAEQIQIGSARGGKSYEFNETHDPTLPTRMWFQQSDEGLILFVVFYSQACRWSRCLSCNLPSLASRSHVGFRELMQQADHVFSAPEVVTQRESIRKVILSNNGSLLDQVTFSSTALIYILARLNMHLPRLSVVSVETRPEFVEMAELEFIARVLAEGETLTRLELAIGFEAFDERIRNDVFQKGLSLAVFEHLARKMADFGFHLKCYFMQKPVPDMTDAQGVQDIHAAIEYLGKIADQYRLAINLHLNATYVGSGTLLEHALRDGRYTPPLLRDIAAAARHARGQPISVFIGLADEGLAVEGGSPIRPGDDHLVAILEEFNRTQNYDLLDRICLGPST